MGTSIVVAALAVASSMGANIHQQEVERQETMFQRHWGTELVWKFDQLPTSARVPDYRVPYSGYIYPDTAGGTANALRKYDMAFNHGRYSATGFEQWDTTAFQEPERRGLFGRRTIMRTPNWHGHCNGWAAAAIRHAEPQNSVRYNNVVFSPADIKGLLAEIYIYNETLNLAGPRSPINAGAFHAIITNWLGRGGHPIGMEADPGEEKWNYPIFGYSCSTNPPSNGRVVVNMKMSYAKDSRGEYQQSPRTEYTKNFVYGLTLNSQGEITGGDFYRGSSMIDMLWLPVRPKQGKTEGNMRGNPHVNVDQVLAIWRASVSDEVRQKWPVVDPPKGDRFEEFVDVDTLIPVQDVDGQDKETEVAVADSEEDAPEDDEAESEDDEAESEEDDAEPTETE